MAIYGLTFNDFIFAGLNFCMTKISRDLICEISQDLRTFAKFNALEIECQNVSSFYDTGILDCSHLRKYSPHKAYYKSGASFFPLLIYTE